MFKKLALLFLVILTVYLLLPDVDLSQGSKQWIAQESVPLAEHDNLFNAIAGLTVAADENMTASGINQINAANIKLTEFLNSEENLQSGNSPDFDSHWTTPALVPTEGINILCDPRAQDCREIWLSQKNTIEQLINENGILLNRYQDLKQYPEYRNTLLTDVRSPVPDYSILMSLNRLHGAGIALRYSDPERAATLTDLNNDIAFLRRLISQADTLIIKMVALSMLKHDLYLYSSLMDTRPDEIYLFDELPALTSEERSIEEPIKYEFRMNTNLIYEIKTYPQLITGDLGVPYWLPFPMFRANHSINMVQKVLNKNLKNNQKTAIEFYQRYSVQNNGSEFKPGWLSYLYNPIGCILFSISIPDYSKYIIRIHDMDGLISMINLKRHIKRENLGPDDIEEYVKEMKNKYLNPYTGEHIDWNPGEQTLSIRSPGSDFITNKVNIIFPETTK